MAILYQNISSTFWNSWYPCPYQGSGPDDLYSQAYDNICVMFASIPNYKEFYIENDINKQGLECIRLLNEIICDFDKVYLLWKITSLFPWCLVAVQAQVQPGGEDQDHGEQLHGGSRAHPRSRGRQAGSRTCVKTTETIETSLRFQGSSTLQLYS